MTLTERIEAITPDAAYYKAWGFTRSEWLDLSSAERAWYRLNVAKAMQS